MTRAPTPTSATTGLLNLPNPHQPHQPTNNITNNTRAFTDRSTNMPTRQFLPSTRAEPRPSCFSNTFPCLTWTPTQTATTPDTTDLLNPLNLLQSQHHQHHQPHATRQSTSSTALLNLLNLLNPLQPHPPTNIDDRAFTDRSTTMPTRQFSTSTHEESRPTCFLKPFSCLTWTPTQTVTISATPDLLNPSQPPNTLSSSLSTSLPAPALSRPPSLKPLLGAPKRAR